ncbi:MAG: cupin domain-containing protein [Bacteroidetes bacterium]|nr:cupin domain-containing protein [Bacteroidota bacterium]
MENKSNDATPQRPQGERVLNAALVEMDLNKFIDQIKREVTWKDNDHNSITIFKSASMRIVLMGLHEKAILKTHVASSTISVQVLEGAVKFTGGEQTVPLSKGQMIALQANIPHSVEAEIESFFLLTLSALEK